MASTRTRAHAHSTRTHTRARVIVDFFPTRMDSGDCEVVACLESLAYMETRQYDTYFASRNSTRLLLSPLERVARHSLVTSGLYLKRNIRGKARKHARLKWSFDDRVVSYISSER